MIKRFKQYIQENIDLPSSEETLSINRKDMPQIAQDDLEDFLKYLKKKGVLSKQKEEDPSSLKASQNQFHKAKIQTIVDAIESGDFEDTPIIVSKDRYVIDGHHRWLAYRHLEKNIPTIKIDSNAEDLLDMMAEYPKSFTKKLYESYDLSLLENGDICPVLTQAQMRSFENIVDKLFKKFNIDFDFTKHFRERMSDRRNKPCIDIKELAATIQKIYKKKSAGSNLFAKHRDAEAVIKDMQNDLNMPVAIEYDRKNDELRIAAKTIMRKKNFRTTSPEIKV